MNKKPIVELKNTSYHFADAKKHEYAFKDVSFSVGAGEFVSIIGPSGGGKSTLLRVIAGVIPESTGTAMRNFTRAGMIFQGHGIFPWLTVLENVAFGLKMENMPRKERERIAREKLKEVGLGGFEKRFPHQLSGGQKQRVAVARAIAVNPDLLIMDEPFSSLDSITAHALKLDVLELWKRYGMAVIMVNHLIPDAVELSDRIIVFGKEAGKMQEIVEITLPRPRDTRSKEFFELSDKLTNQLSI